MGSSSEVDRHIRIGARIHFHEFSSESAHRSPIFDQKNDLLRWMSFILPVTRTKQVQELQERSRTIRSTTRMIRSSSRTTFDGVLQGFKGV